MTTIPVNLFTPGDEMWTAFYYDRSSNKNYDRLNDKNRHELRQEKIADAIAVLVGEEESQTIVDSLPLEIVQNSTGYQAIFGPQGHQVRLVELLYDKLIADLLAGKNSLTIPDIEAGLDERDAAMNEALCVNFGRRQLIRKAQMQLLSSLWFSKRIGRGERQARLTLTSPEIAAPYLEVLFEQAALGFYMKDAIGDAFSKEHYQTLTGSFRKAFGETQTDMYNNLKRS